MSRLRDLHREGVTKARRPHWAEGVYLVILNNEQVQMQNGAGIRRFIDDVDHMDFIPYQETMYKKSQSDEGRALDEYHSANSEDDGINVGDIVEAAVEVASIFSSGDSSSDSGGSFEGGGGSSGGGGSDGDW